VRKTLEWSWNSDINYTGESQLLLTIQGVLTLQTLRYSESKVAIYRILEFKKKLDYKPEPYEELIKKKTV
jgi:hypothetical protein